MFPQNSCPSIALIPARSASKRIPLKNIRILNGHPLIAYAIITAKNSGLFDAVVVSTDSEEIADIAQYYGAEVPFLRPAELAEDQSDDFQWVNFTIRSLQSAGRRWGVFAILRPTNPFRTVETLVRAFSDFQSDTRADTLRAVEKCKQHPGKMWKLSEGLIKPLLEQPSDIPWHSQPYQWLPEVFVQNASLEIVRTDVLFDYGRIVGQNILPFFTRGYEGFDLNVLDDWILMEHLIASRLVTLPVVEMEPFRVPSFVFMSASSGSKDYEPKSELVHKVNLIS